jgi:hypothetical protein
MTGGVRLLGGVITTGVVAENAVLEPTELLAVTATLIVKPPSLEVSRYEAAVAPAIPVQLSPMALQRCH